MRTISALLTLIVALLAPALLAQGGPPPHAGQGRHRANATTNDGEDLVALERFLSMSDAQLEQLQQAIAKVRAMSPAERTALHDKINAYRQLPSAQREQVRAGWGWQNEQDRADWPQMMHAKSDAERATIQAEIQALNPDQRAARKHALLEAWRAQAKAP